MKKLIKNKKHKNPIVNKTVANDIDPWWDVPSYWADLSYKKKLEWYWKYEYDKDGRVFRIEDNETVSKHYNK